MVVIRDYYCSKTSRSNYLFPPMDFVMQSGVLGNDFELSFIDAVRDRLTEAETTARVAAIQPGTIFFLAGAVNFPHDLDFMRTLSAAGRKLVGSGDIFLSSPSRWLHDYPFLDAVALDFTNHDISAFLQGHYSKIRRMAYLSPAGDIVEVCDPPDHSPIRIGIARHQLFASKRYRFPFAKSVRFSVFLTDFGCPFSCSFCVMASLPYRHRPNQEVLAELHELHRLGIYELFWMNQTFGVRRGPALSLLSAMAEFAPKFSWTAFCRPDLLDEELLLSMKNAGCHTIIIGVENGSDEILSRYQKGYTLAQSQAAFALCQRHRMRTVGTFILGLPGETETTIRETSRLAQKIGCDFASFHIAVPRAATQLRQDAVQSGKIAAHDFAMDQSGAFITLSPDTVDHKKLLSLKRQAVLGFYLRPGFLMRQLLQKRSLYEWSNMLHQGFFLIFGGLIRRDRSLLSCSSRQETHPGLTSQ